MNYQKTASFYIKNIPVYGDLILAPMDGVSDLPFRSLMRNLGSAMSYTEFINAIDVINDSPELARRLSYYEFERPVVFQLFDDQPQRLVRAAEKLTASQPDIIDINFGCSARCVTSRGAGAALLRTPQKIEHMISSLVKAIDLPVTAKIRLGWDENETNYMDIARRIQDSGASLIAVHGRTKAQGYSGQANWQAIAEIKKAVNIPVLANGDVRTIADIDRVKEITGCDGVMIGRAAMDNPWIFTRRDRREVPPTEVLEFMRQHLHANIQYYGQAQGVRLFRKFAKRILAPLELEREQMTHLLQLEEENIFISHLEQLFRQEVTV